MNCPYLKNSGREMKKIIVDIDNTLWDLSPVLWEQLKSFNPDMPPPSQWSHWDFWEGHVSMRELFRALKIVHDHQDIYPAYPESKSFLDSLKERGFCILIASHREKGTYNPTVRWLEKHKLPFDEVHLVSDKSVLFDHSLAIIDDSPVTLEKAAHAGVLRAGLRAPWNEGTGHPLFSSLIEILNYLDAHISLSRKS
ncbi:MAG: 5 nucleotidase, deoxy (Pyrimidine), cytosolic type protein [Deltaproteobacteria bacterium]|nr:5 nucleotidase, deoxy (Pyrimidine), cytosolic type protein [Deltaproteobacteria bacterium]